ncbi:MAG: hypothetical protein II567_14635 [Candidatus Riflebacteria bacterium]|nr:hypothetical protein [Candidatus Riflebacteria bacterium]
MLTERCKVIIDEAITAGGDLSKLSPEALAHLETCIECRRSLDSLKALKASSASVIPLASLALKTKISSKLARAMEARRAAEASVPTATKTSLVAGSLIACVGMAGAVFLGAVLSDNKSEISENSSINADTQIRQVLASEPLDINSATSSIKLKNGLSSDKPLKIGVANEDLRNHEPIKYPTQNVPSSKKDSDI